MATFPNGNSAFPSTGVDSRAQFITRTYTHVVGGILAASETLADDAPLLVGALCESFAFDVGAVWVVGAGLLRCLGIWPRRGVETPACRQAVMHLAEISLRVNGDHGRRHVAHQITVPGFSPF